MNVGPDLLINICFFPDGILAQGFLHKYLTVINLRMIFKVAIGIEEPDLGAGSFGFTDDINASATRHDI